MAQVTIHGANGGVVEVVDGHLRTLSVIESEFEHESEENNRAFTWQTVAADVPAAGTILLVQNDSETLKLHVQSMWFDTDNASEFDVHLTDKAALTPAGTAVVGVNLHGSDVAPAIAKGIETNNVQGNIIATVSIIAATPFIIDWDGSIILGKGKSVAIDLTTASTSLASAGIAGYYKET